MAKRGSGARRSNGEGTVYKDDARGKWVGAAFIDGRRRKVVAPTKAEAEARIRALITDAERGTPAPDGNATVADALDLWAERVLAGKDIAPATRTSYEWCADLIRAEIGSRRLRALTVDDVEQMLDRLAAGRRTKASPTAKRAPRPLSRSALVKVRSVLGQVLATAERRHLVARNVARMAELTPTARRAEPRRSLTVPEAHTLMEHLPAERLGPMFLLALTTALRPGEAAGVLWEDVDLEAGTIHVSHAVRLEKGRPVVVDALKTASSYRALKLPRPAVEAMRAHRARQARERLAAASWSDDRLVFATRVGTPLSPANVRRELRDVCRRAGVPEVLPNELRHTGASLMVDAGASLHEVADVMGHTTTRMLDATYRHRLRDTVDTAATVMDGLFDRASGAER